MWSGRPVAVVCRCGHRGIIPLRLLGVHDGDMRPAYSLPIVCSACGKKDFELFVFRTPEEIEQFRATLPPPPPPNLIGHSN
jgi:CRISPR-associated Cas5-like protein